MARITNLPFLSTLTDQLIVPVVDVSYEPARTRKMELEQLITLVNEAAIQIVGPTGPEGPQGPQGVTGAQGPQGDLGPQGPSGPSGVIGLDGPQGPSGVQGPQGDIGPTGAAGDAYLNIDGGEPDTEYGGITFVDAGGVEDGGFVLSGDSVPGPTGPTGPSGGPTGPRGFQGVSGPTGPSGAVGPTGEASTVPGPTGAQGDIGPTGPPGPEGAASTTVGPTGPAGTNGTVGATGPSGPAGVQGPTGPQGDLGPQGDVGPTGPSGAAGIGVIAGGAEGQILAKNSSSDYDVEWIDAPTGSLISGVQGSGVFSLYSINGAVGAVTHNFSSATTFYHTGVVENFKANFTNVSTTNNQVTNITLYIEQGPVNTYIADRVQIDSVDMDVNWDRGVLPEGMGGGIDVFDYYLLRRNNAWIVAAKKTISYAASATETTPTLSLIELPKSSIKSNRVFFQTFNEDFIGEPTFSLPIAAINGNRSFFETFNEDIIDQPTFELPKANVNGIKTFFETFNEDIIDQPTFDLPTAAINGNRNFFNQFNEDVVGEPAFTLPASQVRSRII
jgi:hypothetical protein